MANQQPPVLPPPPGGPPNPPAGPPFNIENAIGLCGLIVGNQALTFATEVFMDDFQSCKDMSDEDLTEFF